MRQKNLKNKDKIYKFAIRHIYDLLLNFIRESNVRQSIRPLIMSKKKPISKIVRPFLGVPNYTFDNSQRYHIRFVKF